MESRFDDDGERGSRYECDDGAQRSVPHPRVTVFFLEDLRDQPTVVARPLCGLVHFVRVRLTVCFWVSVAGVSPPAAIGMIPARFHLAVLLAKVGVGAIARPCVPRTLSASVRGSG